MRREVEESSEKSRSSSMSVVLLGVGWLFALLALPSIVGIRILQVAPEWLDLLLLGGVMVPAVAAAVLAFVMALR